MTAAPIERLRALRGGPRDGALLRYSLGIALMRAGDMDAARPEFEAAVAVDAGYSAAWRALGEACRMRGDFAAAAQAWSRGIEAARVRGDTQALREMQVLLRRLAPLAG